MSHDLKSTKDALTHTAVHLLAANGKEHRDDAHRVKPSNRLIDTLGITCGQWERFVSKWGHRR
jgi:hypothetical protein